MQKQFEDRFSVQTHLSPVINITSRDEKVHFSSGSRNREWSVASCRSKVAEKLSYSVGVNIPIRSCKKEDDVDRYVRKTIITVVR